MTFTNPIRTSRFGFSLAVATVSIALICSGCADPIDNELHGGAIVPSQKPADGQEIVEAKVNTTPTPQGSASTEKQASTDSSADDQITHGKYLVHHVAQCVQCHTPRDQTGELIESRSMTGAAISISGPGTSHPWAAKSVSLAGLGNYDESFVLYLLTHGVRPDGISPKNPMPSFKLNQGDANAVVAYLKSL